MTNAATEASMATQTRGEIFREYRCAKEAARAKYEASLAAGDNDAERAYERAVIAAATLAHTKMTALDGPFTPDSGERW